MLIKRITPLMTILMILSMVLGACAPPRRPLKPRLNRPRPRPPAAACRNRSACSQPVATEAPAEPAPTRSPRRHLKPPAQPAAETGL